MSPVASASNREKQAQDILAEGKLCLSAGRLGRAEMWLRDVLDLFPGTEAAREAHELLSRSSRGG